jgi:hypothetical protein
VDFEAAFEREAGRYRDGAARPGPGQLVRLGNAAYGAGLALLMLGRAPEAPLWFGRAAARWRESNAEAPPASWGRPAGAIKAALLAGAGARAYALWALELDCEHAESAIGRYAAALATASLGRWRATGSLAAGLEADPAFPPAVARALAGLGAADARSTAAALAEVLRSFEQRESYLEDVAVADTVLVLAQLARKRGIELEPLASPLLPPPVQPSPAAARSQ